MKKIVNYILLSVAITLLSSCDSSLLDVQNENTLSTGVFWKTEADIESGVVAIYNMF